VRSKVNPVFGWILASSRIKIHEKQNLQTLKTIANTNKLAKLRTHKKLVKAKPTTVCKNRSWLSFKEWRTVVNSTPQNSSINLPTYSPDNHHCLYTAKWMQAANPCSQQIIQYTVQCVQIPNIIWHGCDSVMQTNAIYSNKLLQLTMNYTGWQLQCFDNQEEHLAGQKLSHEVLARLLSVVRCTWFTYGPADATATPSPLASLKSTLV